MIPPGCWETQCVTPEAPVDLLVRRYPMTARIRTGPGPPNLNRHGVYCHRLTLMQQIPLLPFNAISYKAWELRSKSPVLAPFV